MKRAVSKNTLHKSVSEKTPSYLQYGFGSDLCKTDSCSSFLTSKGLRKWRNMLHVIFLPIAALHMLTKAADVALKPRLMVSWRGISAEYKLRPQKLHRVLVLDPHQHLIGSSTHQVC